MCTEMKIDPLAQIKAGASCVSGDALVDGENGLLLEHEGVCRLNPRSRGVRQIKEGEKSGVAWG